VENLRNKADEFFINLDSERGAKKFTLEDIIRKIGTGSHQSGEIINESELQFAGVFDEVIAANVKNKINPLFKAAYFFANSSEGKVKDDYKILCALILESLINARFSIFSLNDAITRDERLNNKFTPATTLSLLKAQYPYLYIKIKEFAMKNIKQVQSLEEIIEIPVDIFENTEARVKVINKINDYINQLKIDEASKQAIREFLEKSNTEGLLINNYPNFNRIHLVAQLVNFIAKPYSQDQLNQNTCGVNSLFMWRAIEAPNVFIHMFMQLIHEGKCNFPIKLQANQEIMKNVNDLAMLLNQSIKNGQEHLDNSYSPHDARTNMLVDFTTFEELEYYLKQLWCEDIQYRYCEEVNLSEEKMRSYANFLEKVFNNKVPTYLPQGQYNQPPSIFDKDLDIMHKL
jgi:hypothetical protein